MGVFVFLPLVLPLTAWPIARLAEQHLHPRTATRLLTGVAAVMAACDATSTMGRKTERLLVVRLSS